MRTASTAARTAMVVSWHWGSLRPLALRSWFQQTLRTQPARAPSTEETIKRAALYISEARQPAMIQALHLAISSSPMGIRSGLCWP